MVKNLDNLKPAIQKILRKALEKDREKRFQSAKEFIDAIEKSKAYRMPTGAPAWVSGLLVVSLGGVGTAGWFLYQNIETIRELGSQVNEAKSDKQSALLERDRVYQKEKSGTLGNHDLVTSGLRNKIIELQGQIDEMGISDVTATQDEDRYQTLSDKVDMLQRVADEASREKETLNTQLRDLTLAKEKAEEELRALSLQVKSNTAASSDEAKAAKGLDSILGNISQGFWPSVAISMTSLRKDATFENGTVGGGTQIDLLVDAVANLNEYLEASQKGGHFDGAPLRRADALIDQAKLEIEVFKENSQHWIEFPTQGDDPNVDRLLAYTAAIDSVKSIIATNLIKVGELVAASKNEILNGPEEQAPSLVISTAADGGWPELTGFLSRLIVHFKSAESGSELDLGKLRAFTTLSEWGKYVRSSECDMPPEQAAQIKWFDDAKRWYIDRDLSMEPIGLDGLPDGFTTPKSDWRAVLALQTEIANAIPKFKRHSNFYRDSRDKNEMWIRQQAEKADSNGNETTWKGRRYLNMEKGRERNRPFDYMFEDGVLIGDASDELFTVFNPDARIGYWTPSGIRNPRNFNSFPTADDVDQFNAKYSADGLPCLVVGDSSTVERWFNPSIGFVRELSSSKVLELFYR
jgi:hypothetical protein